MHEYAAHSTEGRHRTSQPTPAGGCRCEGPPASGACGHSIQSSNARDQTQRSCQAHSRGPPPVRAVLVPAVPTRSSSNATVCCRGRQHDVEVSPFRTVEVGNRALEATLGLVRRASASVPDPEGTPARTRACATSTKLAHAPHLIQRPINKYGLPVNILARHVAPGAAIVG